MKALFVGGGTGGHINPALAIAGYLKNREPDAEILYVGAKGGMEERLVPEAGYEMKTITISGFQRKINMKNLIRNAQTVKRLFTSSAESRKILRDFKPDVCIGTGGYVCGPILREAAKMGIPCLVHESNAYPGITTKMLSKSVTAVLLAVSDAKKYFDDSVSCVVTGNPVRTEVLEAERKESRQALSLDERPLVLSFGGSLGAQAINKAVAEMLVLSSKEKKYQHIHGFGSHDQDFIPQMKRLGITEENNPQIKLLEYINNMPTCLSAADLVIGRAGAITLSEIEAKHKASILIPSPNVAENHQFHNAMALVSREAAVLIEEKDLTGKLLWEKIDDILSVPGKVEKLSKNAGELGVKDANSRIYREIKRAVKLSAQKK